jgi:nitronate monooxygenase
MAGVQDERLAISVCNAGGLGALPAAMLNEEQLATQLRRMRAATAAPFQVNFFCHQDPVADVQAMARWQDLLRPYHAELGLEVVPAATGSARRPFTSAQLEILKATPPDLVSFHFGLPPPDLLAELRSLGLLILSTATTVEEGLYLAARGVDGIIAQGLEAGGHRGMFLRNDLAGQLDTRSLVRSLVRATDVPVIAAGGIVDAAGTRSAIAAGACAVQAGTAFLGCTEATTSAVHRAALAETPHRKTRITRLFTGRPAQGLINRLMIDLTDQELLAPAFPLAANALAPLRSAAERAGSSDFTPLWCGTRVDGVRSLPAAEVIRLLAAGL